MTAWVIGLVACYVVLGVLLLSLNLASRWPWQVKGAAIAVTGGFFVLGFLALEAMLGWPTEAAPPAQFRLHAALVDEPRHGGGGAGAIYLWLSPATAAGDPMGVPRAYALPYSRELHEQTARAQAGLDQGRRVDGRTRRRAENGTARDVQLELFEAPPATLPDKTG